MRGRQCTWRQVSKSDLEKFVNGHVPALAFDGYRYTREVDISKATVWRKTLAYVDHDGKCYVADEA